MPQRTVSVNKPLITVTEHTIMDRVGVEQKARHEREQTKSILATFAEINNAHNKVGMSLKSKNAFRTLAKTIMLLKQIKLEQEKCPPDSQIRQETIRVMDSSCSLPVA